MTIFSKATAALTSVYRKAASIIFSGGRGSWYGSTWLGGTKYDYETNTKPTNNAIVVACMEAFVTAFSEAPIRLQRRDRNGDLTPEPEHAMIQLLSRPNPYYSGVLMWKSFVSDWLLGNAYLWKQRSGLKRVVELYWIPSSLIEPKWPDNGSAFITHYEYTPNGRAIRIEPSEIVHLRNGFDPNNIRKGLSRLAALVREVATDDEAANFTASLLRNMGVPGLVIAPSGEYEIAEGEAERIKVAAIAKTTGDRRGEPLVMGGPTTITAFGFSPQQMDMKMLRRIPEERISAAIGVPAIVAGLGAGLDRSTYSNMEEARSMFYETSIVPTYRLFAAEIASQLLADFDDVTRCVIDFDLGAVRVLQQDEDALHTRVREDVRAGLFTINEGREMLGMDALSEGGDVLLLPVNVAPTDPAEMLASPEPLVPMQALPPARALEDAA